MQAAESRMLKCVVDLYSVDPAYLTEVEVCVFTLTEQKDVSSKQKRNAPDFDDFMFNCAYVYIKLCFYC